MYLATLPTLRGSTQRFVLARVHLRVRKARSCSYPTRTDQKRNRPRGTSSDRLPCDHISEITVPRSATKIATCLSGWRRAAERPRVRDFYRYTRLIADTSSSRMHAFVRGAIHCQHRYELCFLLAKNLTEAADALYGTLSHMLVFSQ